MKQDPSPAFTERPRWSPDRNEQLVAIEILLCSPIDKITRDVLKDLEIELRTGRKPT